LNLTLTIFLNSFTIFHNI